MGDGGGTDALRKLAPTWSLAGDNQLLSLLQSTHQRIVSACEDVNSKMEEMSTALSDASIHLQNVNNKFMALSNSQFIESRVYDDDADVSMETTPAKETPKVDPLDEASMLKRSLAVLETMHEAVTILDSDSECSDDEEMARVVLKPKDLYAGRPLPHIIGSQAWKNKWHAGLIVEDSDTDSSTSKPGFRDSEQYSESEPESERQTDKLHLPDRTISDTSSELASEQDLEPTPTTKQTPSDIAAELARRLGSQIPPKPVEPEPEYTPPKSTKVYKPEQPTAATIFSDEPPPIERYSDESSYEQDEDDIFAELHKNKPYSHNDKVQSRVNEDLFGYKQPEVQRGDVFSDFSENKVQPQSSAKQKSTLFDDEEEPELFAEKPHVPKTTESKAEPIITSKDTKKPVGGISLFGSNKGAESIGAAILKRNQRKSSTSSIESSSDVSLPQKSLPKTSTDAVVKKEKDIFDDLFAKSEKLQKKVEEKKAVPVKSVDKKVDLFSDNIFDDIDDIFSSNVVKVPTKEVKKDPKSIFGDDDDLFADIAAADSKKQLAKQVKDKGLFDSDNDDLFTEKVSTAKSKNNENASKSMKHVTENKTNNSKTQVQSETIIGDSTKTQKSTKTAEDSDKLLVKSDGFSKKAEVPDKIKSIFDDDSDNDIFANLKPKSLEISRKAEIDNKTVVLNNTSDTKPVQSSPLFEDDIDELFVNTNKSDIIKNEKIEQAQVTSNIINKNVDNDILKANEAIRDSSTDNTSKSLGIDKASDIFGDNNEDLSNKKASDSNFAETKASDPINSENKQHESKDDLNKSQLIDKVVENNNNLHKSSEVKSESKASNEDNSNITEQIFNKPTNAIPSKDLEKDKIETAEDIFTTITRTLTNETNILDDFKDEIVNSTLMPGAKVTNNTGNAFDDIFSEPPIFEKPKEPKKSRNINALFDDDSDDEALFFKKNDAITDEKPEDFAESNISFGLFVDEPPAIDVDFTTKTDVFRDDNIFTSPVKENITASDLGDNQSITEEVHETSNEDIPAVESSEAKDTPVVKDIPKDVTPQIKDMPEKITSKNDDRFSIDKLLNEADSDEDIFNSTSKDEIQSKTEFTSSQEDWSTQPSPIESDDELFKTQKSDSKSDAITTKDVTKLSSDSDEDWLKSLPELPDNKNKEVPKSSNDTTTYSEAPDVHSTGKSITSSYSELIKSKPLETQSKDSQTKIKTSDGDEIFKKPDVKDAKVRKIGRLNTKNFNINVNALLPGSSPKKVKDQTDGQSVSVSKEEVKAEDLEEKEPTSLSFEEKPESEVLDNKLSKQRVRIQVKRRPSTRRARHEAARKSGIDFGDSTDSSSIDDAKKSSQKPEASNIDKTDANIEQNQTKTKVVYILNDEDIFSNKPEDNKNKVLNVVDDEPTSNNFNSGILTVGRAYAGDVASTKKEDSIKNYAETNVASPKIDDAVNKYADTNVATTKKDVVKNYAVTNVASTKKEDAIKDYAEANVASTKKEEANKNYAETSVANTKKDDAAKKTLSIFDDSDGDDMFKKSTIKNVPVKKNLFDSDSDDGLFAGTKKDTVQKKAKVTEKVDVKGPLFGDDDDDLFSVSKKQTVEVKPHSSTRTSPKEPAKSTEPVFDDPLSLLDNDD